MKLTFVGTRASTETASPRHARHSALLIDCGEGKILFDCGSDWLEELPALGPQAIFLTHAHQDHAGGLTKGAPCPVFATAGTWEQIVSFPIAERRLARPRHPLSVAGITVEAIEVEHSLRAPAVGYRISAGGAYVFYLPDVADLPAPAESLRGIDLYIGDGTAPAHGLLRTEAGRTCGHAPLVQQIDWCRSAGLKRMIITHCGPELTTGDAGVREGMCAQAKEAGIDLQVACDGLELTLP